MEQVQRIIDLLETSGTVAWEAALRQVWVSVVGNIITTLGAAFVALVVYYALRRYAAATGHDGIISFVESSYSFVPMAGLFVSGFAALLAVIGAPVTLFSIFQAVINPEYAAIQLLIGG